MSTISTPARTRATVAVAALAAAVGLLAGCTGDGADPDPSGTTTANPSPTGPFVGTDRSDLAVSAELPAVKGGAVGVLEGYPLQDRPATLNVAEVRAIPEGTLLTHWYTGADSGLLLSQGERSWENVPTLVDRPGQKVYEPFTYATPGGDTMCVCTDATYVRGAPQPRTILYPALPDTVTTIEISQAGFDEPISVPVTR